MSYSGRGRERKRERETHTERQTDRDLFGLCFIMGYMHNSCCRFRLWIVTDWFLANNPSKDVEKYL